MGNNFMVALLSGLMMGVIIMVFVLPAMFSRKWGSERDFRRALEGRSKPFKKSRFEPTENITAFRKVLDGRLSQPLTAQEIAAVRSVAPELAVCLEYDAGKSIDDALLNLERQLTVGRDEWWSSPDRAERERKRFAERVATLKFGATDKGECPSCGSIVAIAAAQCSECKAEFGGQSAWSVRPLA